MSDVEISKVLAEMRLMTVRAQGGIGTEEVNAAEKPEFSQVLKNSIDSVNETQKSASELTEAFQSGNPNVDITQVMIALQKADVSFQAITQVRNKLVDAYQEIMRMSV